MKKVRALKDCFVGNSLRKIGGPEFYVDDDQPLRTKKLPPVLQLVDEEPKRTRSKGGVFKKKAPAEEPAED